MNFADFALQLTNHADLELVFEFNGNPIYHDYHLTEVLRSTVDAIDCGGAVDHWTETVLQLVEPGHSEGRSRMTAGKAWSILQHSQAQVPLPGDSVLMLEFRGAGALAAQRFHVKAAVANTGGQLHVLTEGAPTQCKAAGRAQGSCGATAAPSACCAPGASATASASQGAACCA